MMNTKWMHRFMLVARHISTWSKDLRTKVGAVAVNDCNQQVAAGYNGLPRGVKDLTSRMEASEKYHWTVHAEANVVAQAARVVLKGSTVVCTHCCCAQCAALLIQAGVKRVVYDPDGKTHMSVESFQTALTMFEEAGVEVIQYACQLV